MAPVKGLFEPVTIGAITAKNRICIPPMLLYGHAKEGVAGEAHWAHYEALAKGQPGLVIQEATCVSPEGRLREDQLGIWEDGQIPGLREIVRRVHAQDCPIFIQLHHGGLAGREPICPSAYVWEKRSVTGRPMTLKEIDEVREKFIAAGSRASAAGYDGVELHGCHSYLLCQFLNPRVNRRRDDYGQDPTKLLGEIIAGIRRITAPEFVIGVRLGCFEPTLQEGIDHAQALEALGAQFLDISEGFSGETEGDAPGNMAFSATIRGADAICRRVKIPVFGVGGIRLPEDGAQVLRETGLSMVDVGRSALVDPQWPKKAAMGITPKKCLGCKVCQWRIDPDKCPGRR